MTNTQGQVCCGVSNSGMKIDFLEKMNATKRNHPAFDFLLKEILERFG